MVPGRAVRDERVRRRDRSTTGTSSTGSVHIGLQHLIAIGLILAVWVFNVFGTRIAVTFNYLAGVLLMIPLFCFTFLPFINGDFDSANLTYKLNDPGLAWGGLQMALVWIWIMIWSTAPEAAATFAPEYKDTVRDTRKALISSALFILFVNTMVPIGLTGGVGAKTVEAFDYVGALNQLVGPNLTNFFVVVICASFIISMNTATADGSRALYGISKDGLTVKQLGRLNRWNVPGNAMTLDMVINILFVLFVGNLFGILVASNIGYVFANICAISAFILLRRDRPNWPRPIRLAVLLGADRRPSSAPRSSSSKSSASAGSRSPARRRATAARRRRSSASASSSSRCSCSSSGGSCRTRRRRTGVRRRRRCPTSTSRSFSRRRWPRSRSRTQSG